MGGFAHEYNRHKKFSQALGRFIFLIQQEVSNDVQGEPGFWECLMWYWSVHADETLVDRLLDERLSGGGPAGSANPAWFEALTESEFNHILAYCIGGNCRDDPEPPEGQPTPLS